ncbi:hypothetical protein CTA2_1169 [Colletotrichum tanaceti]|uniref:Uncharacterized protein n=1 Tax=Colletotrichum tanaceti TaxID=1306861 RepID=A0A4U6XSV4_9PEZI|nr:hypothetical protein CTA2_1166 [Colletotrichum tanaceti]KAJ0164371.1 hypothetical protein CTA2_1169 [Colletotrichum tanaceti]TKW58962.1 hypothetical protein CTA1_1636 [Colletotrichum tanaceti]
MLIFIPSLVIHSCIHSHSHFSAHTSLEKPPKKGLLYYLRSIPFFFILSYNPPRHETTQPSSLLTHILVLSAVTMLVDAHKRRCTMSIQAAPSSTPRQACQAAVEKGASRAAHALSHAAAKFTHHPDTKKPRSGVLGIVLTTPEGDIIVGDAIPEGTRCHMSLEHRALQKQWLDTIGNNLVPGNWKQLRDLNCPRAPRVDYKKQKAPRERHSPAEEKERKHYGLKWLRSIGDNRRQRHQRHREDAERAWQTKRLEVEWQRQQRQTEAEERRRQAQEWQAQISIADLQKWIADLGRQQDEAERKLLDLQAELRRKTEMDLEADSEDEQ